MKYIIEFGGGAVRFSAPDAKTAAVAFSKACDFVDSVTPMGYSGPLVSLLTEEDTEPDYYLHPDL